MSVHSIMSTNVCCLALALRYNSAVNNELHFIHAVCRENEYVHPSSGMCTACPSNSVSPGGTLSMCTCIARTGRGNEADVTLPCLGECQELGASYKYWLLMK